MHTCMHAYFCKFMYVCMYVYTFLIIRGCGRSAERGRCEWSGWRQRQLGFVRRRHDEAVRRDTRIGLPHVHIFLLIAQKKMIP